MIPLTAAPPESAVARYAPDGWCRIMPPGYEDKAYRDPLRTAPPPLTLHIPIAAE